MRASRPRPATGWRGADGLSGGCDVTAGWRCKPRPRFLAPSISPLALFVPFGLPAFRLQKCQFGSRAALVGRAHKRVAVWGPMGLNDSQNYGNCGPEPKPIGVLSRLHGPAKSIIRPDGIALAMHRPDQDAPGFEILEHFHPITRSPRRSRVIGYCSRCGPASAPRRVWCGHPRIGAGGVCGRCKAGVSSVTIGNRAQSPSA